MFYLKVLGFLRILERLYELLSQLFLCPFCLKVYWFFWVFSSWGESLFLSYLFEGIWSILKKKEAPDDTMIYSHSHPEPLRWQRDSVLVGAPRCSCYWPFIRPPWLREGDMGGSSPITRSSAHEGFLGYSRLFRGFNLSESLHHRYIKFIICEYVCQGFYAIIGIWKMI